MSLQGTTITLTPIEPTGSVTVTPNTTSVTATNTTTTITIANYKSCILKKQTSKNRSGVVVKKFFV